MLEQFLKSFTSSIKFTIKMLPENRANIKASVFVMGRLQKTYEWEVDLSEQEKDFDIEVITDMDITRTIKLTQRK